jgi:hypothetical protein
MKPTVRAPKEKVLMISRDMERILKSKKILANLISVLRIRKNHWNLKVSDNSLGSKHIKFNQMAPLEKRIRIGFHKQSKEAIIRK